jgi:molybdopterin synthase sulfur carrier subunit
VTVSVLFFASLRELAGIERTMFEYCGGVDGLVKAIGDHLGEDLAEALMEENVRVAVNQTIVAREHELGEGDEIAFLPPVTGG